MPSSWSIEGDHVAAIKELGDYFPTRLLGAEPPAGFRLTPAPFDLDLLG
ncbi:hypothetical protein [Nonomuraea endophytica]|uniref:Uncharacterized protein n=1 Tax=Nonomuraea endophytica TaxID=714136 RepID=A0A7W8ELN6_9ACTN|nr:hypothetical protein [Nonomuraea endophytica]MBB5084099.1 hypothetical protein [Nonomuraea endophytica]